MISQKFAWDSVPLQITNMNSYPLTPEAQIIYWREVIGALNHPHRKKFVGTGKHSWTEAQIQAYCNKWIKAAEEKIENEKIKI